MGMQRPSGSRREPSCATRNSGQALQTRAGAPFAPDAWVDRPGVDIWAYERGWLFARLFPRLRDIGSGSHVDPTALRLFSKAMDRGDIL
jgi:hypothetical protein